MSGDDLRVTTAHLVELAVKQAARRRRPVGDLRGRGSRRRGPSTHGIIASATAGAVEAVLSARRSAGTKMADDLG